MDGILSIAAVTQGKKQSSPGQKGIKMLIRAAPLPDCRTAAVLLNRFVFQGNKKILRPSFRTVPYEYDNDLCTLRKAWYHPISGLHRVPAPNRRFQIAAVSSSQKQSETSIFPGRALHRIHFFLRLRVIPFSSVHTGNYFHTVAEITPVRDAEHCGGAFLYW